MSASTVTRERRIALGLCTDCGGEPAIHARTGEPRSRCEDCARAHREASNTYNAKRRAGKIAEVIASGAGAGEWVGKSPEEFYQWAREKFEPVTTSRMTS